MKTLRTVTALLFLVGAMTLTAGCCGYDPCDPFPDPCGCNNPCDPCAPNPCDPCQPACDPCDPCAN